MSLWPFRYLVVVWNDEVGAELDRPLEVRGRERVVDDAAARRAGARSRAAAARSVSRISGLVGVSTKSSRVVGVMASLDALRVARVDVGERAARSASSTLSNSRKVPP